MVAGGWMKINNFHSCIMLLWNIASMCTMQFIHSIRGQETFSLFSQNVCLLNNLWKNGSCLKGKNLFVLQSICGIGHTGCSSNLASSGSSFVLLSPL